MMIRPRTILAVLFLSALAALSAGCGGEQAAQAEESMTREQFLREYSLAGQTLLIEFGRAGNEVSDQGLRTMIDLSRSGAIPGLNYARVEVSADGENVDAYYRELQPSFPVIRDPNRQIAGLFDAQAVPTFVLLDRFGRVRYSGGFPMEQLHDWVVALSEETSDPGRDAPQFGVAAVDGPTLLRQTVLPGLDADAKPLAEYAGKQGLVAVLVDTRCPFAATAREEMTTVSSVLTGYDISSVLINIDDPPDIVRRFYREKNVPVPVIFDGSGRTQHSWNVASVPTVVFFDNAGAIRYEGKAVWSELATAVNTALGLPDGKVSFQAKGTEYG